MYVPEWFVKSLKVIDPTWRVEQDNSDGTYMIMKDVSVAVPLDGGRTGIVHGPRTVAVFQGELCEAHLNELRSRKKIGERMNIVENPANELLFYQRMNREAKEKRKEMALEMMTEGFMKMHKMATSQTFIMPGDKHGPEVPS